MSAQHVNSVVLVCDGCGKTLEDGRTFPTPMDARGNAYGAGWRFPPMLTKSGSPSPKNSSDVCPECLPGWKPVPIQARAHYRRANHAPEG
jgi:hypothetical protein